MKNIKNELREKYKLIRSSIKNKTEKELMIFHNFQSSTLFDDADCIFAYSAISSEADVSEIIRWSYEKGKKVALPVCTDSEGNMEFYIVRDTDKLLCGRFSISEPDASVCEKAVFSEKSVCLVPGICFDKSGSRIGWGKGYYDRFLDKFTGVSVGVCFESCVTDECFAQPHDKNVTYLITDKKIYNFCK